MLRLNIRSLAGGLAYCSTVAHVVLDIPVPAQEPCQPDLNLQRKLVYEELLYPCFPPYNGS